MIRHATDADIPRIVEIGGHFIAQSTYKDHIADNPSQRTVLAYNLIHGDGGILVSEHDGIVAGMLGYILHTHFISGERMAGEVFWWVEPEHRGDGLRLMKAFEAEAARQGALQIQMIAPIEQVATLYRRLGYTYIESTFQKRL